MPRLRLAKLIAQRGVSSRRGAEDLIRAGEVRVNDELVTEVATLVDPEEDRIKVEGRGLPPEPKRLYYVMYKPKGMLVGRDEKGRPSVLDVLDDLNLKVEPVGRLDFNSEGALLLTNDGELGHQLVRKATAVPQRYMAKVYRTPSEGDLNAIAHGVVTPEGRLRPAKARVVSTTADANAWVEITTTESGPRVVQRILSQLGHPVSKLRRESYATVSIRGMERAQIRVLTGQEISRLQDLAAGVAAHRAGRDWRKKGFAKPKPKARRPGTKRKSTDPTKRVDGPPDRVKR